MKNLYKVLIIPIAYLPAIIMLLVSHSFDWQGLGLYYIGVTVLVVMVLSGLFNDSGSNFCSNCGNLIKTNSSFCTKCGNKI